MHTAVQNVLTKEVSRKEFIALAISGVLSIFGISALIKKFGEVGQTDSSSYGGSAYGGAIKRGR